MPQTYSGLPEFDNPPVSEVAMSVSFLPIEKWQTPLAGLYWDTVKPDYPIIQVHPPIPSQIEKFGEDSVQAEGLQLTFYPPDFVRVWLTSDPSEHLVQIQRDRFVVNWRKVKGDEIYPRYEIEIRPRFQKEWERFREFIASQKLGELEVTQCEVTYVNDIPKGQGWKSLGDIVKLFSFLPKLEAPKFLPFPEKLSIKGSFVIPNKEGRLHFAAAHKRRDVDKIEVFQLTLIARGQPKSSNEADILQWMDLGREWIVRGFDDLTTEFAHTYWKRRK